MQISDLPEWVQQRLLTYVLECVEVERIEDPKVQGLVKRTVAFIDHDRLSTNVQEVINDHLEIADVDARHLKETINKDTKSNLVTI